MKRRDILRLGAAAIACSAGPAFARSAEKRFFGAGHADLGLQLYTLEPDLEKDFDGTLAQVARIGFRTVEVASLHGRSPADFRRSLDKAGLSCRSLHALITNLWPGDDPNFSDMGRLIAAARTLGTTNVVLPLVQLPSGPRWGKPVDLESLRRPDGPPVPADRYEALAEFLNESGQVLQKAGLRLGYHNHNMELAPVGGSTGLEILLKRTNPRYVDFELDAGWVAAAGRDTIEFLNAYPGRFRQMHVKDVKASTVKNYHLQVDPADVGSGAMDWAAILPVAAAKGVRNFFLEQEAPFPGPRMDSVAKGYAYLTALRISNGKRAR